MSDSQVISHRNLSDSHVFFRHKVFTNDLNANGYGKYAAQHYYQTDVGGPYDNDALQGTLKTGHHKHG